ncbi:MAG: helix-turn-helix domain-containing protein [Levilactobacillus sp.]|jgi:DNA-binding XRE family transcriptional regulator|uniref:helix-turn-helix domain-containing protein n=1 Tax=Levilactobacillus sp. TaxID=2767919 RepID=UPI00258C0BCE|nr:helix-turn-helix transcriptional regulator [Levilactobacillus sp.]MCI1552854.1 helix-turn-helix domain-containing protein [Levilactobacillus sp.]MCI1597994.1 helix-turn-helix domain-containing protein [Levilactobacillus sp.]MCI1605950.1 helix-turn-helix domain-containing protein [Levilactobacillus sp.]
MLTHPKVVSTHNQKISIVLYLESTTDSSQTKHLGGIFIAEFSIQLRNARIAQGFSQNEVATILHVTRQSISKWENEGGTKGD